MHRSSSLVTVTGMQATVLRGRPEGIQGNAEDIRRSPASLCLHESTEYLGSGGSMIYRQCARCGDVLLVQAGRTVAIPSR
jgi:hypothetical protein